MAVVQISKIQVRRGQKNSLSGVPQLSSAEFAWAVDSQELFIGNGSVAEGAPYVGNTKIITEHDNLLEIASSYRFAPDYLTGTVPRSLQGKLDEYVSVADFGAVGDGSTDCVAAFDAAFLDLFRNTDPAYRKVLTIPNGEYLFLSDLKIPSNAVIRGETENGVVLNIGVHNIRFTTEDGEELLANFNSTNKPRNIKLENFTVQRTTGAVVFSGVADSTVTNVSFNGEYELTDTISNIDSEPAAVFWENLDFGRRTTNLKFIDCSFNYNSISVKASQSTVFDTEVDFIESKFFVNYCGTYISGVARQGNIWKFDECVFEEMYLHAFKSTNGRKTLIASTKFKNCGNAGQEATQPVTPIVYFGEKIGNIVLDCQSNRQQAAATVYVGSLITVDSATPAITEVYNGDKVSFSDRNYSEISNSASATPFAVLSALNKSYTIRYFLTLGTHSRTGKLTLSVNDDKTNVAITDEYQYSPSLTTDPGGATMTNFEFAASLLNNSVDVAGVDTVVLQYINPTTGAEGSVSFDVAYGV